MPKYNFYHDKCGATSEIIVFKPVLEGDRVKLECDACGEIDILIKKNNEGTIVIQGCTQKGENG